MSHPSEEITTIESEVRRRITQLIADNERLRGVDYVILETAALIGVSVALAAFEHYEAEEPQTENETLRQLFEGDAGMQTTLHDHPYR